MNKIIKLPLIILVLGLLYGCGTIQLKPTEQSMVAKIAGRRIGHTLAQARPDIAYKLVPLAEIALIREEATVSFANATKKLLAEIEDPLLKSDIEDLLSLVEIQGPEIPSDQMKIVRAALKGFLMGVKMAKGGNHV